VPHHVGEIHASSRMRQTERRDPDGQAGPARRRDGLDVRLGHRQLGGGLVEAPLEQLAHRVGEGQLGLTRAGALGKVAQESGDRAGVAGECQAEDMVGEKSRRLRPVARRLEVPHGVHGIPLLREPARRPPMEVPYLVRQRPAQLEAQEVDEQLVVAKPRALIGRGHPEKGYFRDTHRPTCSGGGGCGPPARSRRHGAAGTRETEPCLTIMHYVS
jgi:hypothetical protein